jgi:hypothetical protein
MIQKTVKNKTLQQYFVPEVLIASLTKGKNNNSLVSIEDLIQTRKNLGIDIKELLLGYSVILITLIWGAQVKLNSKLLVNRRAKDSSIEKVFQQTDSHAILVKILSHSIHAKTLLTAVSIQKAINKDYYGLTDEESTNEGYINAICNDIEELIHKKGSGLLRIYVTDPETREVWLRASNSSLRSTWCSTPTYSPNKLASATTSIKTVKPDDLWEFLEKVWESLDEIIDNQDIPTRIEIIEEIHNTLTELNCEEIIDDTNYGTVGAVPLETIFGFNRNSIVNTKPINLPGIAATLKSDFAKKSAKFSPPEGNTTKLKTETEKPTRKTKPKAAKGKAALTNINNNKELEE